MFQYGFRILLFLVITSLLGSCTSGRKIQKQTKQYYQQSVSEDILTAHSLADNMIYATIEQRVTVVLPPSYYKSQRRYPVVYYLHSQSGDHSEISFFSEQIQQQMKTKEVQEFIIVGVNGHHHLGHSFFSNSPVTGNWEKHFLEEVIPYIESSYRVIPDAFHRGIAGFSSGASAAINIALSSPTTFGAVYALSPMLLTDNNLETVYQTWENDFIINYGMSFSPDTTQADIPFANVPSFDNSDKDATIVSNWNNGLGNYKSKIKTYTQQNTPIEAFQIEYGKDDFYTWVPKGCDHFTQTMKAANQTITLSTYDGGHADKTEERMINGMLPFFNQHFYWYK